jgi:hypothetical protein
MSKRQVELESAREEIKRMRGTYDNLADTASSEEDQGFENWVRTDPPEWKI